jgi:hypothetical protein
MSSGVAWLSFDAEQQRRTQLMLAALSNQSTVDELGLGVIRDLIARELHPGLTVLHRRAKYLLFIPWDYQRLSSATLKNMLQDGRRAEVRTMDALRKHYAGTENDGDDWGIIGRRQGELVQQLPSSQYWGLLRQLGILQEPGSVHDFCRRRVDAAKQRSARSFLHEEGEVIESDMSGWSELPPRGDFKGFNLSRDEAEWMRQRFLATESDRPDDRTSLVSWLLDPARRTWWTGAALPWQHPERDSFPEATAYAMNLGRDLDEFIHSARITYNYLCALSRPDHGEKRDELIVKYRNAMAEWQSGPGARLISEPRLTGLNDWAVQALSRNKAPQAARQRWMLTFTFIQSWHQIAESSTDLLNHPGAADLLRRRETWLKHGRARLANVELLRGWQGDAGYFHMDSTGQSPC